MKLSLEYLEARETPSAAGPVPIDPLTGLPVNSPPPPPAPPTPPADPAPAPTPVW